ncbi:MAG: RNA degradosome polyphosphate kinase [Chloroflexi bacterium]|nr:MAG: RNA degradosome polyphosphate kinase [Chloroflexota bacterium]
MPATTSTTDRPALRPARRRRPRVEQRYLNRELSWLDFNERVLALAADHRIPLLERVKFSSIFASNLDEFYQVRVAGLRRQIAAGLVMTRSSDGLTAGEQLARIAERVELLAARHARLFLDDIGPALASSGIRITRWADLSEEERHTLEAVFDERIFPVLTPLAVDPGHPFPYISNLSLNLAVEVTDPDDGEAHFARVKVPPLLGRFASPGEGVYVPLEDVIAANLGRLFPGMGVVEHHAFRVTRNADLDVDDDGAEDLLEALEDELRKRRFSPAVRLEVEESMSAHMLELLVRELLVAAADVQKLPGPLNLGGLMELHSVDRPDLKDPPFQPVTPPVLAPVGDDEPDLFAVLRRGDVLVHHPYESFATSVEAFIEQAADDPQVLAIKQTVYRTSGSSPIVNALVRAAEAGKQVVVLVEIKARFDEQNNIAWARMLERSGCHIVYGVSGLKTHAKLCLVVRAEDRQIRRYVHIGTGNYHSTTARIYEDVGLLTADPQLGADVGNLFNFLTGYSRHTAYRSLIVAPHALRRRILELIRREARLSTPDAPGYICIKANNLIDEPVIDALYAASADGVQVDLIVRSICALRPGVPGLSDSIRVRSILGRFLEHSRIFQFRNGGEAEVYIGSADLMHRNLDRRVETVVRVDDPDASGRLIALQALAMRDNAAVWTLDGDGRWSRVQRREGEPRVEMQSELIRHAGQRA